MYLLMGIPLGLFFGGVLIAVASFLWENSWSMLGLGVLLLGVAKTVKAFEGFKISLKVEAVPGDGLPLKGRELAVYVDKKAS